MIWATGSPAAKIYDWEAKDWLLARKLYEEAAPALDETRTRRLGYLRRRTEKESGK